MVENSSLKTIKPLGTNNRAVKPLRKETAREKDNHKIYLNTRWRKLSKRFRQRHPLCRMCAEQGRITAAQCVDHIIPHAGLNDENFWREDNLQSLCISCHSKKTLQDKRVK